MANAEGSLEVSQATNSDSVSLIGVGDTFANYEQLVQAIDQLGKQSGTTFNKRDSKLVVRDIERTKYIKFDDEDTAIQKFRYSYLRFACKRYGTPRSRGKGIRLNQSTQRIGCPAQIVVSVDPVQDCFIVRSVNLWHNHTDDTRHCYRQDEMRKELELVRKVCVRGVVTLLDHQLAHSHSAVTEIEQTDDHFLVSCINEEGRYIVDLAANHCNCSISSKNGLPCAHIFAIRQELGVPTITMHDLPPRFRRGDVGAKKEHVEDEALQETLSASENLEVLFAQAPDDIDQLPFELECESIEEIADVSNTNGCVKVERMEDDEEEEAETVSVEHRHNTRKRKLPNARETLNGGASPRRTKPSTPIHSTHSSSPSEKPSGFLSGQNAQPSRNKNTRKQKSQTDTKKSRLSEESLDTPASKILLIDGNLQSNAKRRKFEFTDRQKYHAAFNLGMKIADLCASVDEPQFSSRLELLQDLKLLWESGEDATIVQVVSTSNNTADTST